MVDVPDLSPIPGVVANTHYPWKEQRDEPCSLYAVHWLLTKARPKIVTLEQMFGILYDRFVGPFN